MIGAFARMLGSRERLLTYEETIDRGYAVKARSDEGHDTVADIHDGPPEAFVQKVSDEGGDVYVAPVLDALRAWVRKRLAGRGADEAAATDEDGTVSGMPENPQTPPKAGA